MEVVSGTGCKVSVLSGILIDTTGPDKTKIPQRVLKPPERETQNLPLSSVLKLPQKSRYSLLIMVLYTSGVFRRKSSQTRGIGAAGSAPHWQCGGHGFESRMLQ